MEHVQVNHPVSRDYLLSPGVSLLSRCSATLHEIGKLLDDETWVGAYRMLVGWSVLLGILWGEWETGCGSSSVLDVKEHIFRVKRICVIAS